MKKIGIVGLGIMGKGIAHNFLKKGYPVNVWNRTAEVCTEFGNLGAVVCDTPAQVTVLSDIVFEITADDESTKIVWNGIDGILSVATFEKVLITCATISVARVEELIKECKDRGFNFMDMPMTGGRVGAETGSLTLLCGGSDSNLEKVREPLTAIASKVLHLGPEGHGMRFKLILNFLQAVHIVGFGQAMKIAKHSGMDLQKVADALADRPGGIITSIAKDAYFKDEVPMTFSTEWIAKDVNYAKQFAGELKVSLLDDVIAEYTKLISAGFKDTDWTQVIKEPNE